jgi:hypothetical protein
MLNLDFVCDEWYQTQSEEGSSSYLETFLAVERLAHDDLSFSHLILLSICTPTFHPLRPMVSCAPPIWNLGPVPQSKSDHPAYLHQALLLTVSYS